MPMTAESSPHIILEFELGFQWESIVFIGFYISETSVMKELKEIVRSSVMLNLNSCDNNYTLMDVTFGKSRLREHWEEIG